MLAVNDSYRVLLSGLSHRESSFSDAVDALGTYSADELDRLRRKLITETIAAQVNNNPQKLNDLERMWEILINGIGNLEDEADVFDVCDRIDIIRKITKNPPPLPGLRAVKTGLIDSIASLWEKVNPENQMWARGYLESLTQTDQDEFIRTYAQEAIAEWI